jgi:outer membrane protein
MLRFRLAAVLAATLAISAVANQAAAEAKIAVVDLQRAINETEEGRTAKARLKKLFDKRQTGLDKKQKDLMKAKEDFEKRRNVLSQKALAEQQQSLQQRFMELQQLYMDYQKELAAKEGELTKVIISRMEKILRREGQKKGYSLILERSEAGVIFVPSNLDLTDLVIQKYNAEKGSKKKKKK